MINIIGPINQLGYGITTLNIVKALQHEVALWPISQPQVTTQEDADIVSQCMRRTLFPQFDAPCIRIWHQNDMSQFVGRNKHIGFPIFELDTFSNHEIHHLEYIDYAFVCSNWAKQVIENNVPKLRGNISVIPLGVDNTIFEPCQINNNSSTIFFNCGKWEIRKGHDILVEIFNKAFEKNDNVELWLMCDNPFLSEDETKYWHKLYYESKLGSKIKIIPRLNTQKEVYKIMQQIDCGIFPSRAEGWNLEALELMSCGKQLIITNYSAHTQFCNIDNSFLVNISELELAKDNKWFFGQGNWAKIGNDQIDQFIEHIRYIHSTKQNNLLNINLAGIDTALNFSWHNTAQRILENV